MIMTAQTISTILLILIFLYTNHWVATTYNMLMSQNSFQLINNDSFRVDIKPFKDYSTVPLSVQIIPVA